MQNATINQMQATKINKITRILYHDVWSDAEVVSKSKHQQLNYLERFKTSLLLYFGMLWITPLDNQPYFEGHMDLLIHVLLISAN